MTLRLWARPIPPTQIVFPMCFACPLVATSGDASLSLPDFVFLQQVLSYSLLTWATRCPGRPFPGTHKHPYQLPLPGSASVCPCCPPQFPIPPPYLVPSRSPGQSPHKPIMELSSPSLHPFLPKSQCPASQTSWVSAEEEASHLLGAQPTRRQSGGAMGWAEGEGEKRQKQGFVCVFFLHPSQGGVSAGGDSP